MPTTTSNPSADLLAPIKACEASWSREQPCGSAPFFIIVNAKTAGFCPVCPQHAASWPVGNILRGNSHLIDLPLFELFRKAGLYTKFDTLAEGIEQILVSEEP